MGLLSRLEHEVVKRLKPFLAHGQDASLKITPSTSQLRVRLRDVSLDVAALNEAAMSTTSLLVHEVVIEEADLKLSLLSFPMWTVIVRGIHIVVKPRFMSFSLLPCLCETMKAFKWTKNFAISTLGCISFGNIANAIIKSVNSVLKFEIYLSAH